MLYWNKHVVNPYWHSTSNKVSRGETICCHRRQFDGAVLATLTSGFDFQRGISYWCSVVTIAIKCTVVELDAWNRQTDRRTDGRIAVLLNARYQTT